MQFILFVPLIIFLLSREKTSKSCQTKNEAPFNVSKLTSFHIRFKKHCTIDHLGPPNPASIVTRCVHNLPTVLDHEHNFYHQYYFCNCRHCTTLRHVVCLKKLFCATRHSSSEVLISTFNLVMLQVRSGSF